MQIDFSEKKEFLHGCFYTEKKNAGLQLHRMTPRLMDFYRITEHREIRALCPSGVKIILKTNSRRIELPVIFGRIARPIFTFDIWVDGFLRTETATENRLVIELDGAFHEVEINLPHLIECFVGTLETEPGSEAYPVAGKADTMLFIGDSIMQGMTVSHPCLAYADRLARFLNTEYYNLSVGGAVLSGELGDFALDYPWNRIVFGFGVNDFNTARPLNEFIACARKAFAALTTRRDADIVLLAPIPLAGGSETNASGLHFADYHSALEEVSGEFPCIRFIDGRTLLAGDVRFYVDGIHPNDVGEDILFENLKQYYSGGSLSGM